MTNSVIIQTSWWGCYTWESFHPTHITWMLYCCIFNHEYLRIYLRFERFQGLEGISSTLANEPINVPLQFAQHISTQQSQIWKQTTFGNGKLLLYVCMTGLPRKVTKTSPETCPGSIKVTSTLPSCPIRPLRSLHWSFRTSGRRVESVERSQPLYASFYLGNNCRWWKYCFMMWDKVSLPSVKRKWSKGKERHREELISPYWKSSYERHYIKSRYFHIWHLQCRIALFAECHRVPPHLQAGLCSTRVSL